MQYHIETVDPKFLDLKQFPLSPSLDDHSAPTLSAGLRRSDDSFVTEDIHLGFRNQPISGGPRRSSDDQLEILGPFEFANTYLYGILFRPIVRDLLTLLGNSVAQPKNLVAKHTHGRMNRSYIPLARQSPYPTGYRA